MRVFAREEGERDVWWYALGIEPIFTDLAREREKGGRARFLVFNIS